MENLIIITFRLKKHMKCIFPFFSKLFLQVFELVYLVDPVKFLAALETLS